MVAGSGGEGGGREEGVRAEREDLFVCVRLFRNGLILSWPLATPLWVSWAQEWERWVAQ